MNDLAPSPAANETPGARPTASLSIGHLARISLYWLGLTAIDGAVGVFTQNRLNFDGFAPAARWEELSGFADSDPSTAEVSS